MKALERTKPALKAFLAALALAALLAATGLAARAGAPREEERPLGQRNLTSRNEIPAGQNQLRTQGTGWKQGISLADMTVTIGGAVITRNSSPRDIERALPQDGGLELEIRVSAHDRDEGLARMAMPLRTSSAPMELRPAYMTHAALTVRSMYLSQWTAGLLFGVTNAGGARPALPMDARLQSVTVMQYADYILGTETVGPLGLRIGMTAREVSGIFGDSPTETVTAGGSHVWWFSPDGSATALSITFSGITRRVTQFTVHF